MFYNGATQGSKWRIGWIAFDASFTYVVARGDEPLITPPPSALGDTDIALAASAVEAHNIYLYYPIADKDVTRTQMERGNG